jgi:ankyrin repeat protein
MSGLRILVIAAATLCAATSGSAQAPPASRRAAPLFDLLDRSLVEPRELRALIARGADLEAPGGYRNLTPLLKALDRAGGPMAAEGDLALVRILIAAGANVDGRAGGETPLCNAISPRPSEDLVLLLLRAGANPNVPCAGETALEKAVLNRNVEIATMLLEAGAKIPSLAGRINADPVLARAAHYGPSRMVSLLIRHGASVEDRGFNEGTPLMRAKTLDVAKVLVAAGADVQARDSGGQSVLAIHEREGRHEIAAFLQTRGATAGPALPPSGPPGRR